MQARSHTVALVKHRLFALSAVFLSVTALGGLAATRAHADAESSQDSRAPKWACDRQTVTAEPVWRGQRGVTFDFDIRNEGTAPLVIKAQGG